LWHSFDEHVVEQLSGQLRNPNDNQIPYKSLQSKSQFMSDPEKKSHWQFLANLLGATPDESAEAEDVQPEDSSQDTPPSPPVAPPAEKSKKKKKPRVEPAKKRVHWGDVAKSLGVDVPEEPEPIEEPETTAEALSEHLAERHPEPPPEPTFEPIADVPETVDVGQLAEEVVESQDQDTADPLVGWPTPAPEPEEVEEIEVSEDAQLDTERPTGRRRRRGRRRRERGERERVASDRDEPSGVEEDTATLEDAEVAEEAPPRESRRRRRRGSGESSRRREKATREPVEEPIDQEEEAGDSSQRTRKSRRNIPIPSWQEAIDGIIAKNLASRQKSRRPRGRGRRSGNRDR
jgi:ribonuclease E